MKARKTGKILDTSMRVLMTGTMKKRIALKGRRAGITASEWVRVVLALALEEK